MIDFHTHILPGFDDGAKTLDESIQLLKMEEEQGVDTIVLTPHYYHEREDLKSFLQRRQQAYERLMTTVQKQGIPIRFYLGAEVRFTRWLASEEAVDLCFTSEGLILVELPFQMCPPHVEQTLSEMQLQGMIPILAHVDRYPYLRHKPDLLYQWISKGAFAQINADALLKDKDTASFVLAGMKHNLIHLMGSDTHSVDKRPPKLLQAMQVLEQKSKRQSKEYWERRAQDILQGEELEPGECTPIKKFLGWR